MINEYTTSTLPRRHLMPVNVHATFCKGCGIAPAPQDGRDCPTCLSIAKGSWQVHEPLPKKVHFMIVLALLVLIAGIVAALRI